MSDLFKNQDAYDGQPVKVRGVLAADPRAKVSRRGNPYYTFTLMDPQTNDNVSVFSFGVPPSFLEGGAHVIVEGTYHTVKRVGRYTFYNEIEAERITQE